MDTFLDGYQKGFSKDYKSSDKLIRIPRCRAVKETEKAMLIDNQCDHQIRSFWIPKSGIAVAESMVTNKGDYGTLVVKSWLLKLWTKNNNHNFWHWSET